MERTREEEAIAKMRELLRGPDPFNELVSFGQLLPAPWRDWPPEDWFVSLRCFLQTTQDQIALKSGLSQSQVSKLEGGCDSRLSTWRKAYAAMGFDLVLVPVARYEEKQLRRMSEEGRSTDRWWRQHARPRRWRLKQKALEAESGGADAPAPSG